MESLELVDSTELHNEQIRRPNPHRAGSTELPENEHPSDSSQPPQVGLSRPQRSTSTMRDKQDDSPSTDLSNIEENSEIDWRYLTYDTKLTHPDVMEVGTDGSASSPEPPDLTPYANPLEWSNFRKSSLLLLSCIATAVSAYAAGSYAPGIPQMSTYFKVSRVAVEVGITVFTAGFGVAPMVLAPFSELNGRRPIFLITGFLFFVFVICSAVTRSFAGMLIARFLTGCAGSTFSTMVGGVVSDIYIASDRNAPMTLFTAGALFGTGIGPLVSGFVAQHISWRWIFYILSIIIFVLAVALLLVFKETRGPVLLSRKAHKLNQWYEAREAAGYFHFVADLNDGEKETTRRIRWKVKADEERASLWQMIRISLVRPFYMLVTEPVVFFFSLWVTFAWSVLYSLFGIVPYMFETVYGFNTEQSGAVYSAISVAAIISTIISLNQERIAAHFGKHSATPEGRLYYSCVQSVLLPIGLFWFGWTSLESIPWIVPTLAVGCATMGIFSVYLAVFNYLADCYGPYASSAIAAQSCCRNLVGGAFPIFTEQMYRALGFGGGGSLMGGIGLVLTLVPWVLVFYGPRIRARSKFASKLLNG